MTKTSKRKSAKTTLRRLIMRHAVRQMFGRVYTEGSTLRQQDDAPAGRRRAGLGSFARRIVPRPSVYVRHLDCGSCNGCELELAALENPLYDMGHLGFEFKASPRHADILVLTGPYTRNLDEAARRAFAAMPGKRRIVAVGDCAVNSCGCKYAHPYALTPMPDELKGAIVARVPGCPPTPAQIIEVLTQVQAQMWHDRWWKDSDQHAPAASDEREQPGGGPRDEQDVVSALQPQTSDSQP